MADLTKVTSGELWDTLKRRNALLAVAGYDVSNERMIPIERIEHLHPEQQDYVALAYVFNAHPKQVE